MTFRQQHSSVYQTKDAQCRARLNLTSSQSINLGGSRGQFVSFLSLVCFYRVLQHHHISSLIYKGFNLIFSFSSLLQVSFIKVMERMSLFSAASGHLHSDGDWGGPCNPVSELQRPGRGAEAVRSHRSGLRFGGKCVCRWFQLHPAGFCPMDSPSASWSSGLQMISHFWAALFFRLFRF